MKRYWFKPKRYGFGATPISWEGWALEIGCAVGLLMAMLLMVPWGQRVYDGEMITFFVVVGIIIAGTVYICRWKTEWRWRWGNERD